MAIVIQTENSIVTQIRTGLRWSPNDDQSLKTVVDQIRQVLARFIIQTAFLDDEQNRPNGHQCAVCQYYV